MAVRTKLFYSNKSQAVRLARDVAFPGDVTEVEVLKIGRTRIIVPAGESWMAWLESGPFFSPDFPEERDQGVAEDRESF